MSDNQKRNKVGKTKPINSVSLSLKELAGFAADQETTVSGTFSEKATSDDDKVNNLGDENYNFESGEDNGDYIRNALNKIVAHRKSSRTTTLRVRRDFHNLLTQTKVLHGFEDYNLGEIVEAFFNAYINEHKEYLKKTTALKRTI